MGKSEREPVEAPIDYVYWIKLENWTSQEALLLLTGFDPHKSPSDISVEEKISLKKMSDLLERGPFTLFESKSPEHVLRWAKEKQIRIPEGLAMAALKVGLSDVFSPPSETKTLPPEEKDAEDNRGKHWLENRINILSAALQVLSENPEDKFRKKNGKINADALSDFINDNRHRWRNLKNEKPGTAHSSILRALRDALKSSD